MDTSGYAFENTFEILKVVGTPHSFGILVHSWQASSVWVVLHISAALVDFF